MGTLVTDAQPLVALLANERTAPLVHRRLQEWVADGDVLISAVNWCEVVYAALRRTDVFTTTRAEALLGAVPVRAVNVGPELATYAAEIKVAHRLGLGDCFAAALALMTDSPLLTGDADFLPLAEHGLSIEWVGDERP
jgi:uncharacterized protein with PIN domain